MRKYRALEPELYDHPVLRRAGFVARDLFIYAIATADDEGRFHRDAYTMLEGCFSRDDPVTLAQAEEALGVLEAQGLLLRYGPQGEFGSVTGWYEHQYRLEYRQPSALPSPPCDVTSWEDVEIVRRAYSEQTGKALTRAQSAVALRWKQHNNLVLVENKLVLAETTLQQACFAETTLQQACFAPKQPLDVDVEVDVDVDVDTTTARGGSASVAAPLSLATAPDDGGDDGDPQPQVRGPTLKGRMVALREHVKAAKWPKRGAVYFLFALKDVLEAEDTWRRFMVSNVDDASDIMLAVLQEEPVNVGLLGDRAGTSRLISRLVEAGARYAQRMDDEREAHYGRT